MASSVGRGPVAADAAELAEGLKKLRGQSCGLLKLARRQGAWPDAEVVLSKTQLWRYEKGDLVPPLQHAGHLDRLYEGAGWVDMSIRSLRRTGWNPWRAEHGYLSTVHALGWPAPYAGQVWVALKPDPDQVGVEHRLELSWGPWRRELAVTLDVGGVVLTTGKAADADGAAVVCDLTCEPACFALHGIGEITDEEVQLDIRRGWFRSG